MFDDKDRNIQYLTLLSTVQCSVLRSSQRAIVTNIQPALFVATRQSSKYEVMILQEIFLISYNMTTKVQAADEFNKKDSHLSKVNNWRDLNYPNSMDKEIKDILIIIG